MAEKTIQLLKGKADLTAYSDGTADGLLCKMAESGVDISVALPVVTKPKQFDTINSFAASINKRFADNSSNRIISFGGIHPDNDNPKDKLKQLKDSGFIGIKLHPDYQRTFIDDIKYLRIIEYAAELDMMVSIHSGLDVGLPETIHCTPQRARAMLDAVQPSKVVLAHMGGFNMWNEVEDCLVGENVYFDTAVVCCCMKKEQAARIIKGHGADKILFATDSPWYGQIESIKYMNELDLDKTELEMIMSRNASILLELE